MIDRGRSRNLMGSLCLSILLMGLGQGAAHAQTKLVKPLNGGTLVINKAGSYFLGGNYNSDLVNSPIITVTASFVTINLNGFSIIGPLPGAGTSGVGINTKAGVSGLTVVNGTITRVRGTAIVLGSSGIAGGLQLINNNLDGVRCTSSCLVTNNIITGNGGTGLNFSDTTGGYQNNILNGNGATVLGGTQLGTHTNVCNGTTCP